MKLIRGYIKFTDSLSEKTGHFFSWFTAILVLVVCFDVVTRYLFNESSVALQESEWHLFALIFLGGAAYTLKLDEHVRIDLFYSRYSDKTKAIVNFLGSILFLIPFALIVIISSQDFVVTSFRIGEISPDAGGLPARYILKAFIPISFFLILLQGLSLALRSLFTAFVDSGNVSQKENSTL
jgi:TRAP-type mannitol/chloroaromatic compound transport system permease small subunit